MKRDRDAEAKDKTPSFWVKLLRNELNALINTNEDLVYGILNLDNNTLKLIVEEYGQSALLKDINKMDDDEKEFMKYELISAGIQVAMSEKLSVNKTSMTSTFSGSSANLNVLITYSIPGQYDSYNWFVLNDPLEVFDYNEKSFIDRPYRLDISNSTNTQKLITKFKGNHKIVCRVTKGNEIIYFIKDQSVGSVNLNSTLVQTQTTGGGLDPTVPIVSEPEAGTIWSCYI